MTTNDDFEKILSLFPMCGNGLPDLQRFEARHDEIMEVIISMIYEEMVRIRANRALLTVLVFFAQHYEHFEQFEVPSLN